MNFQKRHGHANEVIQNVLAWVMDEASAFRTVGGKDNAAEVYKSLRSSAMSRFGWMHWLGMIISFPRKQQGDFTLSKYEASLTNPNIFGDRGATWEVNPRWEKGHPLYQPTSDVWVTIEDLNIQVPQEFEEDFLADGIDALTRYKAEPPLTEGGFFENPHTITEAIDKNLQPIIASVGERMEIIEHAVDNPVRRYVTRELEYLPPVVEGRPYFMHADPGVVKDSFTIAVAHTMPETKVVTQAKGDALEIPRVVVDFVLSWDPRPNRPVDYLNVDEVIKQIVKFYGIKRFTADRWNSVHTIQTLVELGVDASDMNFSNPDQLAMYRYLRLCFYNDMISLAPGDEPTQNELKFIKQKDGKIIHDIYGKDRADAVAAVVWNAASRHYSKVRARLFPSAPRRATRKSVPEPFARARPEGVSCGQISYQKPATAGPYHREKRPFVLLFGPWPFNAPRLEMATIREPTVSAAGSFPEMPRPTQNTCASAVTTWSGVLPSWPTKAVRMRE